MPLSSRNGEDAAQPDALKAERKNRGFLVGGFFLALNGGRGQASVFADEARREFHASGLDGAVRIDDPAYVLDYYPKYEQPVESLVRFENGDFIASCGTLLYGKRRGAEALRAIWSAADPLAEIVGCRGHFAVILRRDQKTLILRDALSAYEVYHDDDLSLISTSFLALANCLRRRSIQIAACVEYLVDGVTFGKDTPLQEVRRLDLGDDVAVAPNPAIVHRDVALLPAESSLDFPTQLKRNILALSEFTASFVAAFRGRVSIGFSGGYDSRLMLALLRKQGVVPSLFVYGAGDAADVRIAKQIAEREDIPLDHADKALFHEVTPENFPAMARENFHWNDGFSQFGIFSPNAENFLRAKRSRPPGLVLNGGGGEVFRNYFKYYGGGLSGRAFAQNFFAQFDPRALVDPALQRRFENDIARKVGALQGRGGENISRHEVQALYPHFRCRSWFGRANSIDTKFGDVILPYYDAEIVNTALSVPLRWKHFGNFEAHMIRTLDPKLASYPSDHGFSFDRNTPFKATLPDLLLYSLPPFVRRYNFRIKQRVFRQPARRRTLTRPFVATVLDPNFPIMSQFFCPAFVTDNRQRNRLATLEYLFEWLNVDVPAKTLECA